MKEEILQINELNELAKNLRLSTYESMTYFTLQRSEIPLSVIEIEESSKKIFEKRLPVTKIYEALKTIEDYGLVEKVETSPLKYRAIQGPEPLKKLVKNFTEEQKNALLRKEEETITQIQKLYENYASTKTKRFIWRIYSKDEAEKITIDICSRAKKDIRIMTEHGGWITKNDYFLDLLKKKDADGIKIWTLISDNKFVERERRKERDEFEKFIKSLKNANHFCYKPAALRATIVDNHECIFFILNDAGIGDPNEANMLIYYTGIQSVGQSVADFFNMKCLALKQNLLKKFIQSDESLSIYNDLLFG
ncbi:TrmB family transcriptional regulator [Nitrosarchaeum sp. AC2]|uniref:TrmB family transcriptional regulator n=1 Tax=Nitrosarchaeum sp. AC2 TaxID=2259673 RepID=UPI0015C7912E|nr:helix-turn-helix domain-containing protein [Nitrosarchaeum sp. AC2]QLH11288.1 hypothetical protein DSQ20_07290 [Nitrosarchaeum sp. AC2]